MSVRSAKDAIREARLKAGLTQEQLAEGVCSVQSLSRIEMGTSGVSPATFQALMEHAGAPCERYPVFASRACFDCFYALKQARFHLDSWQLAPAYEALQKVEALGWANNRLYYQEWLLLYSRLQYCSYGRRHQQIHRTLLEALHITRPHIDLSDFRSLLLSQNEIQLLTAIAQEALYLGRQEVCLQIHSQIEQYLAGSKFSDLEKVRMQAEDAIVYIKYLLSAGDHQNALKTADSCRDKLANRWLLAIYLELGFLTGLCHYHLGNDEQAAFHLKAAFYSAHAVGSCYADLCREYLRNHTAFAMTEYMEDLPPIAAKTYPPRRAAADPSGFSDGVFTADSVDIYTLGMLIRDLRTEQGLLQSILCQGLCSKSKLSKIENDTLQPDIALTEALLQRLGMTERIFTFWGSEKEAKLNELKFKIINAQSLKRENAGEYLREMEQLLGTKDVLYRQDFLVASALESRSPAEQICQLEAALECTLPKFDIHRILDYRLSWEELSILNCLADAYRKAERYDLGNLYFFHVSEYLHRIHLDDILQAQIFPLAMQAYCHNLYAQKQYKTILDILERYDISLMKYNVLMYGLFLFYYSQCLGECARYDAVVLPAVYACNINCLLDCAENSRILRNALFRDFAIAIDD